MNSEEIVGKHGCHKQTKELFGAITETVEERSQNLPKETKLTTAAVENAIENFPGTGEHIGLANKQKTFSRVEEALYKN